MNFKEVDLQVKIQMLIIPLQRKELLPSLTVPTVTTLQYLTGLGSGTRNGDQKPPTPSLKGTQT